jgi:hypothetical protein
MEEKMAIKDVVSMVGVLFAIGLGFFNVWRTWKVAHLVDSLLLDDKRFEAWRTAIDTQIIRTKQKTALDKLCLEAGFKMRELSGPSRSRIQALIDQMDKKSDALIKDIALDSEKVALAHDMTAPTKPTGDLLKKVNIFLGEMKGRHEATLLEQANADAFAMLVEASLQRVNPDCEH